AFAQRRDFEIRKRELPHLLARRIAALVIVFGALPPAGSLAAGAEGQLAGFPVVLHEGVDVAAVPGVGLLPENAADFSGQIVGPGCRQASASDSQKERKISSEPG